MHSSHINFRYSSSSPFRMSPRRCHVKPHGLPTSAPSFLHARPDGCTPLMIFERWMSTTLLSSVTATPKEFMSYSFTVAAGRSKSTIPHLPPHRPYKNEFIVAAGGHRTFSHHQLTSTTIQQPTRWLPPIHHRHWST
jgi:hypothetical protein